MLVCEYLDLDMPRALDPLLDEDFRAAERLARLALRGHQSVSEVRGDVHGAHALAAPAVDGLDEDRVAYMLGQAVQQ